MTFCPLDIYLGLVLPIVEFYVRRGVRLDPSPMECDFGKGTLRPEEISDELF